MRTALRAALAFGLLIGFYVLVAAIVGADITVLVLWASSPTPPGQGTDFGMPPAMPQAIVFSVPMLLAAFYGVFTVSRSNLPVPDSEPVSREQAPRLWETVEQLAREVGTRPPSQILLIGDANAMVSEESYLLGLVAGRARLLYIGAPLLVGLDVDELRAVLCHELGHYAGNHTRLAALVYRASASLQGTLERLQAVRGNGGFSYGWVLRAPLSLYARLYYAVAFAVNRRQELEADAAAARIVGARATADALRSAHAIVVSWAAFTGEVVAPMRRAGRLPDDPFSAYRAMLDDPYYRDQFEALRSAAVQESDDRHDTHPGLAARLRALAACAPGDGERDRRLAVELVREHEVLLSRTGRHARRLAAEAIPWREWLILAVESRAAAPARALKRAVVRLAGRGAADAPLAAVLDCLEAGRRDELAEQLDRALGVSVPEDAGTARGPAARMRAETGRDAAAADTRLLAALLSLVAQALVGVGGAVWHLSWTGECLLTPRDITAEELTGLLGAAVRDAREVPRLRLHLAGLGVDVDAPVVLGETGGQPRGMAVSANEQIVASQRRGNQWIVFLVVAVGMIVVFGVVSGVSQQHRRPPQFAGRPLTDPYAYSPFDATPDESLAQRMATWPSMPPLALSSSLPDSALLGRLLSSPPSLPGGATITVRDGDTLSAIAQRCDATVAQLQQLNGLGSSTTIYAGQQLTVPGIGGLVPTSCT